MGAKRKRLIKLFTNISLKLNSPIFFTNEKTVNNNKKLKQADYQLNNIDLARKIVELVNDIKIDQNKILDGISNFKYNTNFKGRWQIVKKKPLVIVDCAHNIDAFNKIISQLESLGKKIKMIFGTLNKIDQIKIIDILPKHFFYYFCEPKIDRFMPIEKIKNRANKNKLQFKAYQSSLNAYNDALTESDLNDLIFVTGSNFVVSEILKSF